MARNSTTFPGASRVRSPAFDLRRLAARQALPVAVIAVLVWLMWDRLAGLDTARIGTALASVGPGQWVMGAAFTGVSFWALGRYDAVVHRLTGTGIEGGQAVRTGAIAIAVAQTVGMGAISGAFVRWRMLPSLSLTTATRVSVIVSLSFLAGWAVLAALAVLLVPLPLPGGRIVAAGVLALAAMLMLVSLVRPGPLARLPLPSLKAMTTILALSALDTIAAGLVLWALLPEGLAIAPVQLVAAYLLALGAGLIGTTPGGVGPFEVALLALLPGVAEEPVLAAVIAYRALYYALPAVIGAAFLARGPRDEAPRQPAAALAPLPGAPQLPFVIDATIEGAPRAEAALLRHGRLGLMRDAAGRPAAMAEASGQSLIALSDPLRPDIDPGAVLADLSGCAHRRFLSPVLYKAGARLAATARGRGWAVLPIAAEAWIDPQKSTENGPARRQLRRKLRKAEAAGIEVTEIEVATALQIEEMASVATDWAHARGGERGFSMGTWDPDTLAWARVFVARGADGTLLGFITVHANAREHTLDLMRTRADAPDGIMHRLVADAIAAARRAGARRFSLAAVPPSRCAGEPRPLRALRNWLDRRAGAGGLRQFKSAFAPRWETLYLAAPGWAGLAFGALDIAREVNRPAGASGSRTPPPRS